MAPSPTSTRWQNKAEEIARMFTAGRHQAARDELQRMAAEMDRLASGGGLVQSEGVARCKMIRGV